MSDTRRRVPSPWRRNADELDIEGSGMGEGARIDHFPIFSNSSVAEFLSAEGSDPKRVLVAGKGLGKTLLLKRKAFDYRNDESRKGFRPFQRTLVAKIQHFLGGPMSYETALLGDSLRWYYIWWCAIGIPVWHHHCKSTGQALPTVVSRLVPDPDAPITLLLDEITSSKTKLNQCRNVAREVRSYIHSTTQQVAIFVDNTDEGLQHLVGMYDSSLRANTSKIWVAAQLGLLEVALELKNIRSRVRLFATIRKEAYDEYQGHTAATLKDVCCILHYDRDEVRDIFESVIGLLHPTHLVVPKHGDPIVRFLGGHAWSHWRAKDENGRPLEEDAFKAIYRHTLGRPRDIVILGEEITENVPARNRSPEEIRKCVAKACRVVFGDYRKECVPHWDARYEEVFKKVTSRIVRRREAHAVSHEFAKQHPELDNPIHFLIKRGLVGYVETNALKQPAQKFLPPGLMHPSLPLSAGISPLYFMHPLVDHELTASNHRAESTDTAYEDGIIIENERVIPDRLYRKAMLEEGELSVSVSQAGNPIFCWNGAVFPPRVSDFQNAPTRCLFACLLGFVARGSEHLSRKDFLDVVQHCEKTGVFGDRGAETRIARGPSQYVAHRKFFEDHLKRGGRPEFLRTLTEALNAVTGAPKITYRDGAFELTQITHFQIRLCDEYAELARALLGP